MATRKTNAVSGRKKTAAASEEEDAFVARDDSSKSEKKDLSRPLIGREEEHGEILRPLEAALKSNLGCCLYVSGVPGTGKTATVRSVLKSLLMEKAYQFDWVEVNGMKMASPLDTYTILYKRLFNKQSTPTGTIIKRLDRYFHEECLRPCVLVIDELDTLLSPTKKSQNSLLYRLLEWPGQAPLSIIAIANTMDLPERQLGGRLASRLGMLRVNFAPYSYPQLIRIIKDRFGSANTLSMDAIEYCARKVGAVSGDARRALNLAQRALSTNGDASIGIREMEAVISSSTQSALMSLLGSLDVYCKLIMVGLSMAIRQQPEAASVVDRVVANAWQLGNSLSMDMPSFICLTRAVQVLQAMGIIRVKGKHVFFGAINASDLQTVLSGDPQLCKFVN